MNEFYKNFCSKIDTKTFNNIQNGLGVGFGGLLAADIVTKANYPDLYIPCLLSLLLTGTTYAYFTCGAGRNYTTDVKELREMYNLFVKNYNKLNKAFDFNDPLQIQTLYYFLYRNGYLSVNHEFIFKNKAKSDTIPSILGTDIINGKGVCRNISGLFSDILNDYGIEAYNIGVFINGYYVLQSRSLLKSTKDDLKKWIDERLPEGLRKDIELCSIDNLKDEYYKLKIVDRDLKPILKLTGNHAITYAFNEGKEYFLDPTQESMYRKGVDGKAYDQSSKVEINKLSSRIFLGDEDRYNNLMSRLRLMYPTITHEEEYETIRKVKKLIDENKDMFERFHQENEELINDISKKLLLLK